MKTTIKAFAYTLLLSFNSSGRDTSRLVKRLACFYLITGFLLFISNQSFSQSAGDYRSNATTMNWNAAASWQKYNGTTWVASTDYPGQNACSVVLLPFRTQIQ